MRRTIPLLTTMALTLLVASGVALATGIGSAAAESSVVGPGESIQKAINAAGPGDTIAVLGGVHRESVKVKKDGVSLRGVDAVLKPPAKSTSSPSCGGVSGFCVQADDVSISGFTVRDFPDFGIGAFGAQNARFVANSTFNNGEYGITAFSSTGTRIVSNHTSGSDLAGIYVGDSPHANATVI